MLGFLFIILGFLCISIQAQALELGTDSTHQMMVITDIHFNPFEDCSTRTKPCPLAIQLNKASAGQWPELLAQYSNNVLPASRQETNYALFRSLMEQIQLQKPDHLLILGDFLAHRYRTLYLQNTKDTNREHYERFVLNTLQYISSAIQQVTPPNAGIYPLLGNNDSYGGKDCAYADYCVIANGSFYQSLAKQWAPLFRNEANKNSFMSTFPHNGYYKVQIPNTNDHILVLNTVLFSNKAQGPNIDAGAREQLQWLEQQLQGIEKAHEKTWIIYHIPPGIDAYTSAKNFFGVVWPFWNQDYVNAFKELIQKYNSVIGGVLSSHTHMDGFLILSTHSGHTIVDTFVPSISPIFGNNPSYKIYSYNDNNFDIHDFGTFYLNLQDYPVVKGWQKEYQFSSTYTPDDGLFTGYKKITANKTNSYSANYIRFYSVNTQSQPINHGKWNYYWCATAFLSVNNYQNCLKNSKSLLKVF